MKMKTTLLQRYMLLLLCVLFLFTINASAQNTASVTGTVMNENGELLTGVTVKATNAKSKESFTTTNRKRLV